MSLGGTLWADSQGRPLVHNLLSLIRRYVAYRRAPPTTRRICRRCQAVALGAGRDVPGPTAVAVAAPSAGAHRRAVGSHGKSVCGGGGGGGDGTIRSYRVCASR
jgi:hypothetical protein